MAEPLREVRDKDEMMEMAKSLEKFFPASAMAHNILHMSAQQKFQNQVLVPQNQDKHEVKICLLTFDIKMLQGVAVYCHPEHIASLHNILSNTSFIGWSTSPSVLFMSLMEEVASVVKEVCEEKQRVRTFDLVKDKSKTYFFPPAGVKQISSLPDGYTLQSIKSEDLVTVYEVWEYSSAFNFDQFIENLKGFESSAIYFKDGEHEKMVGWIMEDHLGAIGKLHVVSEHRRKNLAAALVRNFCYAMKKQNKVPYAVVNLENMPSRNLFEKLGFISEFHMHFHHSFAKQPS